MNTPRLEVCASRVTVGGTVFGSGGFGWIAGPCAVESAEQLRACAAALGACGVRLLRGGLFKPRSSPYSFQGLREAGIGIVRELKRETGIAFVSEAVDAESLELLLPVLDLIQIGSRNCLNYALLEKAGRAGKPVLLKRGFAVTVGEFLNAAEYLAVNGASQIILCERGIRTVTEVTRFTLDLGAVAWLKARFPMPVIADPSHAAGDGSLVGPLTLAAAAAGADGAIIECTPEPAGAKCDARQQITPEQLTRLKRKVELFRSPGGIRC
ncbi:MAG: 3-deoxy-7-phosphoheptulonate synthase [Lentisphaeria bacterium]|nr:3-deoxy-7-phosphoheptulonate synthase [Lentisphaeria bacterium]